VDLIRDRRRLSFCEELHEHDSLFAIAFLAHTIMIYEREKQLGVWQPESGDNRGGDGA
jgi:hypothetical protein